MNEDEPAVIDIGTWYSGEDMADQMHFDLMVFVDLAPVKFGYRQVDPQPGAEPFPTVEEAASQTPHTFRVPLEINEATPFVFTLAIPAEAFGELGAHDVRIAYVPDNQTISTQYGVRSLPTGPSFAVTVNYGGTEFVARERFEQLDAERVYPPGDVGGYLSRPNVFLNPPVDVSELPNTDLSHRFVVPDNRVTLRGWVENAGAFNRADEQAVVVVDEMQPLTQPRGSISLPEAPPGLLGYQQTSRNYAAEFSVPVSLEETGIHAVRAFAFSDPFCRRSGFSSGGVNASNIVYLRKLP